MGEQTGDVNHGRERLCFAVVKRKKKGHEDILNLIHESNGLTPWRMGYTHSHPYTSKM
jgi:hypothetical protein